MQATTTFTNDDGSLGTQTSKYVRLQNGLNKQVDGSLTFIGDYDTATADSYAFYYSWSDARGKIRRGQGFPFLSQPDIRFTRISY